MTRIPYRRCAGIIIALLTATPSLLPPPPSARSLLGHSLSDFFAGTADNTTALPYGLILGTKGTGPYNWTPLGNLSPQAQWQPGFFHDAASGKYILVGMDGYQYYSGVWTYDAGTDLWAKVADKDVPSSSETSGGNAYDAASGKVLFLPYWNASTVRFYDVTTCTWTSQTPSTVPPFTEHFSLALDLARGEFVRFGGDWGYMGGYNNETWTYMGTYAVTQADIDAGTNI